MPNNKSKLGKNISAVLGLLLFVFFFLTLFFVIVGFKGISMVCFSGFWLAVGLTGISSLLGSKIMQFSGYLATIILILASLGVGIFVAWGIYHDYGSGQKSILENVYLTGEGYQVKFTKHKIGDPN